MSKVNDKSVGFVQGTAVLMADGKVMPIEKIKPGDWVMSFDTHSPASPLEPRQVVDTFDSISRDILEVISGEDAIMVGRGQLFLSPGTDWHFAHETAYITDFEGNARDFTVTKINQGNYRIHDIIVDGNHSLIANGFRVHNGMSFQGGPNAGANAGALGSSSGGMSFNGGPNAGANAGALQTGGNNKPAPAAPAASSPAGPANKPSTSNAWGVGNGGGNDNRPDPIRLISSSIRKKQEPPKPPAPDPKALAYAAYSALQDTMDYICDIQITYVGRSYFTVRTAVFEYMKYADALAADALFRVKSSTIGAADKNNLELFNADIVNTHDIIRRSWSSANDTAINLESIKRACLNVKQFVDRSQAVIAKYIGNQASSIEYTVPGLPKPAKVILPTTVVAPEYVKTTADTWVTTTTSPTSGNTYTPATTGGLGASYTKTRVVRGYLYAYTPKLGWKKIGPADQYKALS
jgi:hypothetical protein